MLTPACFALSNQSKPEIKSLVVPEPDELTHLTGRIVVVQLTPVTPTSLLPTAPRIPATWVPCPP